ncbi:MAG TPA: hypothetical protein VNO43_07465 [Candidatus Eisenbacteria bacterium]|nr:hypothetical protein [Candidatus Eisenbacteria bacterium]
MRKRIVPQTAAVVPPGSWLPLELLAEVELTSEDAEHPIEAALTSGAGAGWQAAQPGRQTVRLLFDKPRHLKRIRLVFEEHEAPRTQEFVLRWSPDRGRTYREIVRQQYNFSPPGTTRECEEYGVALDHVTALELSIVPDITGGGARASLAALQVA